MSFEYKELTPMTVLTDSAVTMFTNGTGGKTYARLFSINNTSSAAVDVTLYKVASGGSAGTSTQWKQRTLYAGQSWDIEYAVSSPGLVFENDGDFFQAKASTTGVVNICIMGGQK